MFLIYGNSTCVPALLKKNLSPKALASNVIAGRPDGAIIFDETSFVKKGRDSIGVAKQYCGTIGKVENCQVGAFAAYVSQSGYAMIDKRLFIPEKWFADDYAVRRKKCKLPQ